MGEAGGTSHTHAGRLLGQRPYPDQHDQFTTPCKPLQGWYTGSMPGPKERPPLRTGGHLWGHQRVAAGVSLTQLARAAHINVGTLSHFERGRMIPTSEEYERVTAALKELEEGRGVSSIPGV